MTEQTALVAIATAAILLAALLFLLRISIKGRRPIVAFIRRWIATGTMTSGLVLSTLLGIAVLSSMKATQFLQSESGGASALEDFANAPSIQGSGLLMDEASPAAEAREALRSYADKIDAKRQSIAAMSPTPTATDPARLPDVDTMIGQLFARLEKQPDDVKGWKLLGWSYLNTGRADEAVKAYETALKLEPGDIETKKGLEAARSAQPSISETSPSGPTQLSAASPSDGSQAAIESSALQSDSMIRGMVDQLAKRLETSPNDEDGWMRLLRSRMTLGEKDAAKAALAKALDAFGTDQAAKSRLSAAARDLGVDAN